MANPHKGEVAINLKKAIAAKLITPRDHNTVILKFDYNAMADAELEFKDGKTMVQVLTATVEDSTAVSFHDTRVLLEYGLKHQFPTLDRKLAGQILEIEDFTYVTEKIGEAVSLGFEGNIISKEDMKKFKEGDGFTRSEDELTVGAVEGEDEEKN